MGKTLSFDPIQLPIPLENGIAPSQQSAAYSTFEVQDDNKKRASKPLNVYFPKVRMFALP
ncbi:MAG: hypothetical protein AAFX51_15505 [Cyanobacteria bacterium J06636_28]